MDVFQQKTKILQYETVQEFLRDFTFQKKDYILASRSIYEAFFRDSTGRASIAFHSDYGQGEPDDRMLDAMLKDMREKQPERIIAIGGGSVIDTAKAIAFANGKESIDWDHLYWKELPVLRICFCTDVHRKKAGS